MEIGSTYSAHVAKVRRKIGFVFQLSVPSGRIGVYEGGVLDWCGGVNL